jgi:hypothetical protein
MARQRIRALTTNAQMYEEGAARLAQLAADEYDPGACAELAVEADKLSNKAEEFKRQLEIAREVEAALAGRAPQRPKKIVSSIAETRLLRILKNDVSRQKWLQDKRKLAKHLGVSYRALFPPGPLGKLIRAYEGRDRSVKMAQRESSHL